jgi:hypothetical protein
VFGSIVVLALLARLKRLCLVAALGEVMRATSDGERVCARSYA